MMSGGKGGAGMNYLALRGEGSGMHCIVFMSYGNIPRARGMRKGNARVFKCLYLIVME